MASEHRLDYLDSLRGLAALMVMAFHYILHYGTESTEILGSITNFFDQYLDLGKVGVTVFFIISGFVIPYSIKGSGITALKQFAVSRLFRLYPVYWLSAILGFLILGSSLQVLLFNFTMLQQFFGVENILGLYWTLQLELIFYFLIAVFLLLKKQNNMTFLFVVSLTFLVVSVPMAYMRSAFMVKMPLALPLGLSLMFFGSYFRFYILEKDRRSLVLSRIYLGIFIVLFPVIARLGYDVDFGFHENWVRYVISYFSALAIFLCFTLTKYHNRVLNYLGMISYSVYLFHPLTIEVMENTWDMIGLGTGLRVVFAIAITLIFSHLTYTLIEKPALALGRKVRSRLKD